MGNKNALRLPVVSLGAEHLVIGHLMRRNILTYKAPPNNEGYDLICIHPDPRQKSTRVVRVQVKSRYQTDCDRSVLVRQESFGAFDYLIAVFLNIGFFFSRIGQEGGRQLPEFLTLPQKFVREHLYDAPSGFQKIRTRRLDVSAFKDERGFEQIARNLGIAFPSKVVQLESAK